MNIIFCEIQDIWVNMIIFLAAYVYFSIFIHVGQTVSMYTFSFLLAFLSHAQVCVFMCVLSRFFTLHGEEGEEKCAHC